MNKIDIKTRKELGRFPLHVAFKNDVTEEYNQYMNEKFISVESEIAFLEKLLKILRCDMTEEGKLLALESDIATRIKQLEGEK